MSKGFEQALFSGHARLPTSSRTVLQTLLRHSPTRERNGIHIVHDRRRHQRVNVPLNGRFMRADKQEFPCRITNVSPGGLAVLAPVACQAGERIVIYADELGRFEGDVVRLFDGGFAIRLNSTSYKREKIANQLTWILNRAQLDLAEDRAFGRSVPCKSVVKITLADGSEHECRVQDVSLNGVSVSVLPKPEVGEPVTVGLIRGTVVRHHDRGIGIRFNEIQDPSTIERHFG